MVRSINTAMAKGNLTPVISVSDREGESGFTSIDPLFEKYHGWTPYLYCMNNPVNATDGNGKDYELLIDKNQINVTIPIFLTGPDANSSSQSFISKGVDESWNNGGKGWDIEVGGANYHLNISADVVVGPPGGNTSDNSYYCDNSAVRSYVSYNDDGTGTSNSWSTMHEVGHFLGLENQYDDKPKKVLGFIPNGVESAPREGWEKTIMGEYNGKVTEKTIYKFIGLIAPFVQGSSKSGTSNIQIEAKDNKEKK